MTTATLHLVSVATIAAALKAQVAAVKLADGVTPAFARVELFDSESLTDAFQQLLVSEQRVCLIVPLAEHFETEVKQFKLITRRTVPFALLISDRVIGKRNDALFGTANNPGAYNLEALTLPLVTGQLLPNPNGVICTPTGSDVMIVKSEKEKANHPGRAAIALELSCAGGWMESKTGPGPTL